MYATRHVARVRYSWVMEPDYENFGMAPIGATVLRNNWTPYIQAACNDGCLQPVLRNGKRAAVIVPMWWLRAGLRAVPGGDAAYVIPSNAARGKLSELLTKVAEHRHHIMITVEGYRVAAFVPRPWADEVFRKLYRDAE